MKNKESKHDEYVGEAKKIAAYVNSQEKVIGVYCTNEDMLKAEKNFAIKKLKTLFNYKIQMVIK